MADEPLDPPANTDSEVELDIRAFLPEGTDLGDDWGDDTPEPEIPSWARDDVEDGQAADLPREPEEQIDLSVLEGIEADLIEVDEAIAALDAGDPARSPLLERLTGTAKPGTT